MSKTQPTKASAPAAVVGDNSLSTQTTEVHQRTPSAVGHSYEMTQPPISLHAMNAIRYVENVKFADALRMADQNAYLQRENIILRQSMFGSGNQ